jgi:hypothetical protein
VLVGSDRGLGSLEEPLDNGLAAQAMLIGRKLEQDTGVPMFVEKLAPLANAEASRNDVTAASVTMSWSVSRSDSSTARRRLYFSRMLTYDAATWFK